MSVGMIPVQIRLQDAEREALDQYRRSQTNPPSRARAALELMLRGLNDRAPSGDAGVAA
jgi:hypothetical protein